MSFDDTTPPDALARHSTIVELVTTFQEAERDIRAAFASIVEAEAKLNARFGMGERVGQLQVRSSRYSHSDNFDRPDEAIDHLARGAWACLAERLQLKSILSIAAHKKLQNDLEKGELPAITVENVAAFARQYHDGFAASFEQKIVEVFEWLRPHNDRYKTNSQFEVGERVVLSWCVERGTARRDAAFGVNYNQEPHLLALEAVFRGLDGKGAVGKTYYSDLSNAIKTSPDGRGATEYFEFRCFKNRNLHLRFLRTDLLAQLNRVGGGDRLKPAKAAA